MLATEYLAVDEQADLYSSTRIGTNRSWWRVCQGGLWQGLQDALLEKFSGAAQLESWHAAHSLAFSGGPGKCVLE